MPVGTITTSILNFRATPDQRGTIQRAAKQEGRTLSAFLREAALREAAKKMET
jgi:uncharacterized protein (DUF1778 family)